MKNSLLLVLWCGLVFLYTPLNARADFVEDFDGYTVGSFPSSGGWIADANATHSGNGVVTDPDPSSSSDQALYLWGGSGWAALAYHPVALQENFNLSFSMLFTSTYHGTGYVDLSSGSHWTSPYTRVLSLEQGVVKIAGETVATGLSVNQWHNFDIQYHRAESVPYGTADFFMDGSLLRTWSNVNLDQYSYLGLVSGNYHSGDNMYFDDIRLINSPVPEPATLLVFGTGLAGLAGLRRRKSMDIRDRR